MLVRITLYAVCSVVSFNEYPAFLMRSNAKIGCRFNPTQIQITAASETLGFAIDLHRQICLTDTRLFSANCSTVIPFLFICEVSVSPNVFGNDMDIDAMVCALLANEVGDSLLPNLIVSPSETFNSRPTGIP